MDLVDILLKSVDDCDNEKVEEILKKVVDRLKKWMYN